MNRLLRRRKGKRGIDSLSETKGGWMGIEGITWGLVAIALVLVNKELKCRFQSLIDMMCSACMRLFFRLLRLRPRKPS
jgi:hypothetical protein